MEVIRERVELCAIETQDARGSIQWVGNVGSQKADNKDNVHEVSGGNKDSAEAWTRGNLCYVLGQFLNMWCYACILADRTRWN